MLISPFQLKVIEWVDGSTTFGDFTGLTQRGRSVGAHSRYFPGEWSDYYCREKLKKIHERKLKGAEELQALRCAFDDICANHSPVFRFFFIEKFSYSAEAWYAARMRYTRSVAVISIVGHILGIGKLRNPSIYTSHLCTISRFMWNVTKATDIVATF
jgi:ataxia telangiectasia mutated family protein